MAPVDAQAPAAGRSRVSGMPRVSRRLALGAAVLVVALVVAFGLWRSSHGGTPPLTAGDVDRAVAQGVAKALQQQQAAPPDAATAYQAILPSLVTVTTEASTAGKVELGAGVVIDARGEVLTALHVVAGGGRIQVRFADGTESVATVASTRPSSDIAVLSVAQLPQVVVPAVMGGGPRVGDAVFPVGHPLGLTRTLTAGVVSAVNRPVKVANGTTLEGLIQFDAAVNPGNSGGPLLNRSGQVIGIVTALANPAAQPYFVGIGFAVPIATAAGAAGGPAQ